MLKVLNIDKVNEIDDIYKIKFEFEKGSYNTYKCENIITYDIESSSGSMQKDGRVIGFSHYKYNNDEEYKKAFDDGVKVAVQYTWQVAVLSSDEEIYVFFGRTIEEFQEFITKLSNEIKRQAVFGFDSIDREYETIQACTSKKYNFKTFMFIHNAGFEFQFLRNCETLTNFKVFARAKRKPIKFTFRLEKMLFEVRDTLSLTQKSLAVWSKELPIKKLEEPKDFYLPIRTPTTPLENEEIQYCINDVVSMIYGVYNYKEKWGTLENIPLTQTGEVRRVLQTEVSSQDFDWASNCELITQSYTKEDYDALRVLFQGGYTHANKMHVGVVCGNELNKVRCFDFASSYPAVMTRFKFPVSIFETCNVEEFHKLEKENVYDSEYRWYANIRLKNVKSKLDNSYWSYSKCLHIKENGEIQAKNLDNGRVVKADTMEIMLTDLDWDTFKKVYSYDEIEVISLKKSKAGYLSKSLILLILKWFANKTSLKGVDEDLYNESKQYINSIFGIMVQKLIDLLIEFNGVDWTSSDYTEAEFYDTLDKLKVDKQFGTYQIGCYVTSWARHELWHFIINLDSKTIYCDTDSCKGFYTDDDLKLFEEYNKNVEIQQKKVAAELGFDVNLFTAKTPKGNIKRLGVMEREGDCIEFCTLGAKRYCANHDGEVECTISGISKKAAANKVKSVKDFDSSVSWNTEESEKNIAYYNDNQPKCIWTDRDGVEYVCEHKYGIAVIPTTFDLSGSEEFAKFCEMLQTGTIDKSDNFYKNDIPIDWYE